MLCDICREGLEGMWDPLKTKRLGLCAEWFPPEPPEPKVQEAISSSEEIATAEVEKHIFAHHKTLESFQRSQDQGCVQCNRFESMHTNAHSYLVNDDGKPITEAEEAGYFSVFFIRFSSEKPTMFIRYADCVGGFTLVPVGAEQPDTNLTFDLEPSTNSPKTWALIDTWLRTCAETHDLCKHHSSSGYLPSRLLAVNDVEKPETFRLVMRSECPEKIRYLTLSHCWGKDDTKRKLMLLKSTFDQLREDQPVNTLPKTFQDAIHIASRLGIRYIWVDRLCIFQDVMEDWRFEAASMRDVYRHSYLNISALGASYDGEGCFFKRDPAQVAPTVVQIQCSEGQAPRPFRFELEKAWAWRLTLQSEPIIRRAWVVQERLLSPRVLHFGRKQVFWECRELGACEIHPQTVDCYSDDEDDSEDEREEEAELEKKLPHLWKQLLDAPDRQYVSDPYDQLFVDWNAILSIYTECALTVPSDKLVALSGLANDMKNALERMNPGQHRYLAGLWAERLESQICWSVREQGHRPDKYRAPSWSWASLDAPTMMPSAAEPEIISFTKECLGETQFLGDQDTGEVIGGTLTLSGPWTQVQLGQELQTELGRRTSLRQQMRFIHLGSGESFGVEPGQLSTGQRFSAPEAVFDVKHEMPEKAYCMPIQAVPWAEETFSLIALLLVKVEGQEGTYRRVGILDACWMSKTKVIDFFDRFPLKRILVV